MGKPKRGKPTKKVREIESGDEISDSEPMDAIDEFHQEIDHESESDSDVGEYEVAKVDDRDDSDDDELDEGDDDDEDDSNIHMPSRDALGKKLSAFQGADFTEKQIRKMKMVERDETRQIEEEDATERREENFDFLQGHFAVDGSDSEGEEEASKDAHQSLADMTEAEKMKLLKRQSPLLLPLIEEFKIFNEETNNLLIPLLKCLSSAGNFHYIYT